MIPHFIPIATAGGLKMSRRPPRSRAPARSGRRLVLPPAPSCAPEVPPVKAPKLARALADLVGIARKETSPARIEAALADARGQVEAANRDREAAAAAYRDGLLDAPEAELERQLAEKGAATVRLDKRRGFGGGSGARGIARCARPRPRPTRQAISRGCGCPVRRRSAPGWPPNTAIMPAACALFCGISLWLRSPGSAPRRRHSISRHPVAGGRAARDLGPARGSRRPAGGGALGRGWPGRAAGGGAAGTGQGLCRGSDPRHADPPRQRPPHRAHHRDRAHLHPAGLHPHPLPRSRGRSRP